MHARIVRDIRDSCLSLMSGPSSGGPITTRGA